MQKVAKVRPVGWVGGGGEVVVDNPRVLRELCAAAVRNVLKLDWVGFVEIDVSDVVGDPKREVWCINGTGSTAAQAKYTYTVLPLLSAGGVQYWIGASLEFKRGRTRHETPLTNVTVILMDGGAADPLKSELLRVDWDCRSGYMGIEHAQPHWHVLPHWLVYAADQWRGESSSEGSVTDVVDFEGATASPTPSGEAVAEFVATSAAASSFGEPTSAGPRVDSFHFALAAQWHAGNSLNPGLVADQVPEWIASCIKYTRGELIYLHEGSGRRPN